MLCSYMLGELNEMDINEKKIMYERENFNVVRVHVVSIAMFPIKQDTVDREMDSIYSSTHT